MGPVHPIYRLSLFISLFHAAVSHVGPSTGLLDGSLEVVHPLHWREKTFASVAGFAARNQITFG